MSGFGFTEAQELFRRQVRDFARRELLPGAKERAKLNYLVPEVIRKVADMGLLGVNLPEKYGGTPADWVSVGITVEELARVDFAISMLPHQVIGCALGIMQGDEELCQEWLPPLIKGEKLIALCVTEPECGSDAASMKMTARRHNDGYILRGEKTSISLGMQAEVGLLFAKTDPLQLARGVTAFLVPMDLPGITRIPIEDTGCRPLRRASLIFDDVRIPVRYRIGGEGEGFYIVMKEFDFIRICVALEALGAAQASLEEAIEYAKQRTAFGKPIARFEGVSFKIAEDATLLEAARLLCYRALWLRDQGQTHIKETAMCKWFAPQVALRTIHDALLIHGHFGYSEELPLEQRLRDVMGWELGDGTAEVMKVIISRELMGREYLPYER